MSGNNNRNQSHHTAQTVAIPFKELLYSRIYFTKVNIGHLNIFYPYHLEPTDASSDRYHLRQLPKTSRIFVGKAFYVASREVALDHRAQEHIWLPSDIALSDLPLEQNAKRAVEEYQRLK